MTIFVTDGGHGSKEQAGWKAPCGGGRQPVTEQTGGNARDWAVNELEGIFNTSVSRVN